MAYRAAYRVLRNSQDADDVAHDSMLKALVGLPTYDSRWAFRSWLSTIARNGAIDLIRKRKRISWGELPDSADRRPLQDELSVRRQNQELVRDAVGELPEIYREVIDLHHFKEMKYREIAHTLDVPIGTVMNRIFRARQKMRGSLSKCVA